MSRRRSRARPGRKKGNKCAGCGKTLHTYTESFCIQCESRKAARAELFAKGAKIAVSVVEKQKEKTMHIPKMGE